MMVNFNDDFLDYIAIKRLESLKFLKRLSGYKLRVVEFFDNEKTCLVRVDYDSATFMFVVPICVIFIKGE